MDLVRVFDSPADFLGDNDIDNDDPAMGWLVHLAFAPKIKSFHLAEVRNSLFCLMS